MSHVADLHKSDAPKELGIHIITCSTSRYNETKRGKYVQDISGDLIESLVQGAGHRVHGRTLIPDAKVKIQKAARAALASKQVDVLIITGGTGLSPHDVTIESISQFYEKEICGFGELFRQVSFEQVGSAAMLSRASGGLSKGKAIFCLPGSPNAVQTAMEKLILPELGHIVKIGREH
jgi:molybdopterin adenylyltransferase